MRINEFWEDNVFRHTKSACVQTQFFEIPSFWTHLISLVIFFLLERGAEGSVNECEWSWYIYIVYTYMYYRWHNLQWFCAYIDICIMYAWVIRHFISSRWGEANRAFDWATFGANVDTYSIHGAFGWSHRTDSNVLSDVFFFWWETFPPLVTLICLSSRLHRDGEHYGWYTKKNMWLSIVMTNYQRLRYIIPSQNLLVQNSSVPLGDVK